MPTTAKKRTAVPEGAFDASAAAASAQSVVDVLTDDAKTQAVQTVAPSAIHPHPDNPRKDLGDLTELTDSIRSNGVLQPIRVIPHPDRPGEFMALLGHRRRAAAIEAGLPWVPVVVSHGMDRATQIEAMLVENIQRSDLTVIEEGAGYQDLLDLGVTRSTIAKHTGRAGSTVTQRVKIASLPESFHSAVVEHQLTLEEAVEFADLRDSDADEFQAAVKKMDDGFASGPAVLVRGAVAKARGKAAVTKVREALAAKGVAWRVERVQTLPEGAAWIKETWPGADPQLKWTLDQHAATGCTRGVIAAPESWAENIEQWGDSFCEDPSAHQARLDEVQAQYVARVEERDAARTTPDPEIEAQRKAAEQQSADLKTAASARRRHLAAALADPDAVGQLIDFAADTVNDREFVSDTHWVRVIDMSLFDDVDHGAASALDELILAALSVVEGATPANSFDFRCTGDGDQDAADARVAAYLRVLEQAGYELSTIETQLLDKIDAHFAADSEDGAE